MTLDELDTALAARPRIGDLLTGGATEAEFRDLYAGARARAPARPRVLGKGAYDVEASRT